MISYEINPYVSFIESRLLPGSPQRAVFHRLTGDLFEPAQKIHSLLLAIKIGNRISLGEDNLNSFGQDGLQLRNLIQNEFLIPEGHDPLAIALDQYVSRPIQNPALAYRSKTTEWMLVR